MFNYKITKIYRMENKEKDMIKNFKQFLLESEEADPQEQKEETKEISIGETEDGQKVKAVLKLWNTIKLSTEEFSKLQNMRITQYERDMLTHMKGAKEYKISKDDKGKCTIFHYNQTTHRLMPVGVFMLPKKEKEDGKERSDENN
jgi:hypothetical protein